MGIHMAIRHGTPNDDTRTGTNSDDIFRMREGGEDTVSGLGGNDLFRMGENFDAGDSIDGGAGRDTVWLRGDYSAGLTLGAATMTNVEVLRLGGSFAYNIAVDDGTVAAGERLTVNGNHIAGGNGLNFDGSAERDGHFRIFDSAGIDDITGSRHSDKIFLNHGGPDTVNAGGGHDHIYLGSWNPFVPLYPAVNGGSGNDTVHLTTGFGVNIPGFISVRATLDITSIETVQLTNNTYWLDIENDDLGANNALTLDASAVGNIEVADIDASNVTNGQLTFIGGAGQNTFQGGAFGDIFNMQAASAPNLTDLHGNGGDDAFHFGANYDAATMTVDGGTGTNGIYFDGDYAALALNDSAVTSVSVIEFDGSHNYTVTVTGNIGGGNFSGLLIDSAHSLDLDLSAATTATFSVNVGAGDDTIRFGSNFTVTDTIHGNSGDDTLVLNGSYGGQLVLDSHLSGVETLAFEAGFYNVRPTTDIAGSGGTVTVDGSALTSGDTLVFIGNSTTNTHYAFVVGGGSQTLNGGNLSDDFDLSAGTSGQTITVKGAGGADTFTAGAAADSFVYDATGQSIGTAFDTISGLDFDHDNFDLTFALTGGVSGVNANGASGTLDGDLGSAGSFLAAHGAILVDFVGGGDFSGRSFLVIDMDNSAGYTAGTDYVIEVTGYAGTIGAGNFI